MEIQEIDRIMENNFRTLKIYPLVVSKNVKIWICFNLVTSLTPGPAPNAYQYRNINSLIIETVRDEGNLILKPLLSIKLSSSSNFVKEILVHSVVHSYFWMPVQRTSLQPVYYQMRAFIELPLSRSILDLGHRATFKVDDSNSFCIFDIS